MPSPRWVLQGRVHIESKGSRSDSRSLVDHLPRFAPLHVSTLLPLFILMILFKKFLSSFRLSLYSIKKKKKIIFIYFFFVVCDVSLSVAAKRKRLPHFGTDYNNSSKSEAQKSGEGGKKSGNIGRAVGRIPF